MVSHTATYKDRAGIEQFQYVRGDVTDQCRLYLCRSKRIQAHDRERFAPSGYMRVDFESGARRLHFGQACHARINVLVKSAARTTNDDIRLAGETVHGAAEFIERARIDDVNRNTECDAERNPDHCQYNTPRFMSERRDDRRTK